MKCEITNCKNESSGYYLDDLEVCQSCYENSIDEVFERMKDKIMEDKIKSNEN